DLVVHLVEVGVADLAAVATMERATQLLPVEAFTDLWIRTDDRRLQGHAGTLASGLGRSPADSTTRPTASGHSIEYRCTPRTPGRALSAFTISTAMAMPSASASAAFFMRSITPGPIATPGTLASRSASSGERSTRTPAMIGTSCEAPRRTSTSQRLNAPSSNTGCVGGIVTAS